ncbi:MAG: response regulator transcription factor [Deltaproteobacteria bacterium]|nr:response regulator transcription factor [Deltaproteobacteria bacterium]
MSNTVLIIDDDSELRAFLVGALTNHGFKTAEVSNASQAEEVAVQVRPTLILLDLGLPDGDGLELLQQLRARNATTPVIVLSARDQVEDKVSALDLGANDYLTKPFNMRELLARVRVALRHAGHRTATPDPIVNAGPVRIDHERHEITVDGVPTRLTPIEFRLLSTLARNAGKVLTHRQLLEEVWGPGKETETHYLRVHMASLRRKVERDPARPRWLATEPGIGYRLRDE